MGVYRSYRCPDCTGVFEFFHHPSDEPPPDHCPMCNSYVGPEQDALPSASKVAGVAGKSGDQVYKAMEDSSRARAEMAAEMTGQSVSDMSAMLTTNMKDNLREGDTSHVSAPNAVSTLMQTTGIGGMAHSQEQGHEYARATRVGPGAGAGAATIQGVTNHHHAVAARMVAKGDLSRTG